MRKRKHKALSSPITRDELSRLLNTLHDHVYQLQVNRFIFKKIWQLIQENRELQKRQSHIYAWLHNIYAEAIVMGIRRLCDQDAKSISLVIFLECIKRDPSIISRAAYGNLNRVNRDKYLNLPQDRRAYLQELIINEGYDKLVGKNMFQPRGNDIQKEINGLKRLAKSVTRYADKRIAHFDKEPPTNFPTFGDIDVTIDHITSLVKKYFHLLTATSMDFEPHFNYDLLAPLRVPWLPDEAVLRGGFH